MLKDNECSLPDYLKSYNPGKAFDDERGLIRVEGYFLELKLYGSHGSVLEGQLKEKFLKELSRLNMTNGTIRIKVSAYEQMFQLRSDFDYDDIKPRAKARIKTLAKKSRQRKRSES